MDQIHELLYNFIDIVSTFIETWGVILVLITVLKEIYKTVIIHKFDMSGISKDETLNQGLASALEVLLAAEILKTLVVRTPDKLLEVGALVIIRIFIAFILHWELKQKTHELVHEEKKIVHEERKKSKRIQQEYPE